MWGHHWGLTECLERFHIIASAFTFAVLVFSAQKRCDVKPLKSSALRELQHPRREYGVTVRGRSLQILPPQCILAVWFCLWQEGVRTREGAGSARSRCPRLVGRARHGLVHSTLRQLAPLGCAGALMSARVQTWGRCARLWKDSKRIWVGGCWST